MKKVLLFVLFTSIPSFCSTAQPDTSQTGNVPIAFYGKAVDQDGVPLAHAKVKVELYLGYMASPTEGGMKRENFDLESDENGDWALTNAEGHGLEIMSITKPGYDLSRLTQRSFGYSATPESFHPSPERPILFVLWNKAKKTPVITRDWAYDVVPGSTYALDLTTRQVTVATNSEGDLQFSLTRPNGVGKSDRFDWAFTLHTLHGNLVAPTDEEYDLMAFPTRGEYTSEYETNNPAADRSWKRFGRKEFYVKMHDGQGFAKMEIMWDAVEGTDPNANEAGIRIRYVFNPSGLALTR